MTWNNEPIFHHEDPEGDRIDVFDSPHGVVLVTTSAVGAVAIRSDNLPDLIEALITAHEKQVAVQASSHIIVPRGATLLQWGGWRGIEKWAALCGACGKPVILEATGGPDARWVHENEEHRPVPAKYGEGPCRTCGKPVGIVNTAEGYASWQHTEQDEDGE